MTADHEHRHSGYAGLLVGVSECLLMGRSIFPVAQSLLELTLVQTDLARHDTSVTSVAFTRDGKWLATGNLESEVRVWEIATGRECFTMKHGGPVNSVAFSPDGTLLASASD